MNDRAEFEDKGLISGARPLADPGVVAELLREAPQFRDEVMQLRRAGQRRVPYRCTPAIERVAHDENIAELVESVLGDGEPWVMWGPNIQQGTPNQAFRWHVDIESRHWPSMTVVVGLSGCADGNATRIIPGSHRLQRSPPSNRKGLDERSVLGAATSLDPRCRAVEGFAGFADARFYVFDARCWHCGDPRTSHDRVILLMHYHRASEPRIPLMKDYARGLWFDEPAPYIQSASAARTDTYPHPPKTTLPARALQRVKQIARVWP